MKSNKASLYVEYADGGTTVELEVVPVHVWLGVQDSFPMWFLYAQDVVSGVYLDLRMTDIKRCWRPKTAEEMQLSGTAVMSLSGAFRSA